jgi:amino acid transporter
MSVSNSIETSASGLKKEVLSFVEVLAQSISGIAPSATPALVIPLVFATAGNGTWLAYLFAMVVMVLIGANLNQFTKRSASPGSLYEYVVKGLGSGAGVVSGWALVLAYTLTASAVLAGFMNYGNVLLAYAGITIPAVLIGLVGALSAWIVAYKDIKLSAKIILYFESFSIVLIIALAVIVLVKHGFKIDFAQLSLQGVSPTNIRIGLVLAFFSFTCFESAVSLGDEAKKPLKSIPRVVTISVVAVGLFFILLSYTQIQGFAGSATKLNEATAPLSDLANFNGVGFLGPLISIGALISFWSCFLATLNAGARILFSLGQHGVFNASVGSAHANNKTPHIAINVVAIVATAVPSVLILFGNGLFDIYGWVGTIATYGFLLIYSLIVISVPVYLYHEQELKTKHVVLSVVTFSVLLIPIVGSVYPLPALPYGAFPFVFAAWLVIGGLWFLFRRFQSPQLGIGISTKVENLHKHFRGIRAEEVSGSNELAAESADKKLAVPA